MFCSIIIVKVCGFCYICDKVLHNAIESCLDLPVRFDVEFRPFTLLNPAAPMLRNAYLMNRFGKEQAEMKLKAVSEFAQKAGLKLSVSRLITIILSHFLIIPVPKTALYVGPLRRTGYPPRHTGLAARACRTKLTDTYLMLAL